MRILVVITRMYTSRGGERDEFVENWGQEEGRECESFTNQNRGTLLVHGYKNRWRQDQSGTSVSGIIEDINNHLDEEFDFSVRGSEDTKFGISYHPDPECSEEFRTNIEDKLLSNFENVKFIGVHGQNAIERDTPIGRLSRKIEAEAGWDTEFESVWDKYKPDEILESKLELLHRCLIPEGARRVKSKVGVSSKFKKLDEAEGIVEGLAGFDDCDCFSKEYINKLTDLRDQLLGMP